MAGLVADGVERGNHAFREARRAGDGAVEATDMPDLIEPWQPFKDMRAITRFWSTVKTGF